MLSKDLQCSVSSEFSVDLQLFVPAPSTLVRSNQKLLLLTHRSCGDEIFRYKSNTEYTCYPFRCSEFRLNMQLDSVSKYSILHF